MSCHGSSRKRIAIIAVAGAGVAGIAYISLTSIPGATATLPVVLAFAACPAMCAAMGGAMWLNKRFSKRKNLTQMHEPIINSKQEEAGVKTENKTAVQDTSTISD